MLLFQIKSKNNSSAHSSTAYNTAYTLRALPLPLAPLGDIALFCRNVVYADTVR
jgi:hypothetical protein